MSQRKIKHKKLSRGAIKYLGAGLEHILGDKAPLGTTMEHGQALKELIEADLVRLVKDETGEIRLEVAGRHYPMPERYR